MADTSTCVQQTLLAEYNQDRFNCFAPSHLKSIEKLLSENWHKNKMPKS